MLIKYKMWVADVDQVDGWLYAEGHKEGEEGGVRSTMTIDFRSLMEELSQEEFNQMIDMNQANSHSVRLLPDFRTGRIFEVHVDGDKDGVEKVVVPEYRAFTQDELDSAAKKADEWAKLFEDGDKSDSSND